jgi:uncharacterized membrane protein YidH (DUF202 family)
MSRLQLAWLHVSVGITAVTGIVFAVMKYVLTSADEFAVVNHPLQPWMLSTHVLVAPLALFILGWTFSNHMLPKWRFGDGTGRRSGTGAMWLIVPMVASGYLLQVSVEESLREAMAWAHGISSGLFAVVYVIHLLKRSNQSV